MDIVSAVEELHGFHSKDLSKVFKDSENSTFKWQAEDGTLKQVLTGIE
jgi:hypothetical protein